MAQFRVTAPDGATYNVTAPDDATEAQVMQMVQAQSPAAPKTTAPDVSGGDAALIAAGKTLTRLGQGAQQAFYGMTGNQPALDALKAKVDEENRLYQPMAEQHPIASAVGEAAPALVGGPLTMAAEGALEYGTPQEKGLRATGGFIGGKVGELGGNLVGRALQPIRSATADAAQAVLDKFGVQGLPGQITGSTPLQWAEQTLAALPGGGRIRALMGRQQEALNKGAMSAMGSDAAMVTPEAVQGAKAALGKTFQDIPAATTVAVDRPLAQDLTKIEQDYYKNLSPDQRQIVRQYVDDILSHSENGMPGDVYQKARSRISARANSTNDSELKNALTGVYKALDAAFDRSSGDEASAAMKAARGQYRAAKTLEPLANETGNVSAARVANTAKGMPGELGDLAKLGSLMRQFPNSGTAQRLIYQSLLSGAVGAGTGLQTGDPTEAAKYAAGSFAAPYLATQLLTRAPVRNYLTHGLLNVSPQVERLLERAGAIPGGLLGLELAR